MFGWDDAIGLIGQSGTMATTALAFKNLFGNNSGTVETGRYNAFDSNEARKQREYNDTAYQRTVADMRAAGINPALAFASGSPQILNTAGNLAGGSPSSYQPATEAIKIKLPLEVTSALKQIELIKAEKEKTEAEKRGIELNNQFTQATLPSAINSARAMAEAEYEHSKNLKGIHESKRGKALEWLTQSMNPIRGIIGGSVSASNSNSASTVTKK